MKKILALVILLVAPCRSSLNEVHSHMRGSLEDQFGDVGHFIQEACDQKRIEDSSKTRQPERHLTFYKRLREPIEELETAAEVADVVYKSKSSKPKSSKSSNKKTNRKCGKPPKTCEMDLCTSSKLTCIRGSWYCSHTPKKCPSGETCDPVDGKCKDSCGDPPSCETDLCVMSTVSYCVNGEWSCVHTFKDPPACEMDLCTISTLTCVDGTWVCEHKPKVCPQFQSCNVTNGECTEDSGGNKKCPDPQIRCEVPADKCLTNTSICVNETKTVCIEAPKVCHVNGSCDPADGTCKNTTLWIVVWHKVDHAEGEIFKNETEAYVAYEAQGTQRAKRLVDRNNAVIKEYSIDGMKDSSWCQLTDWATKALSTGVAPVQNPNEPAHCFDATTKIVPCVAVIDNEQLSSDRDDNEEDWKKFRANYPKRPFCLLMPYRSDTESVFIPFDALNDTYFKVHTVNRTGDNDSNDVDDWFSLCDLEQYNQADVKFIGLYIDGDATFGVKKQGVKKSYNQFVSRAASAGVKICEEYDQNQDWIKPFMGSLSPSVNSCKEAKPIV